MIRLPVRPGALVDPGRAHAGGRRSGEMIAFAQGPGHETARRSAPPIREGLLGGRRAVTGRVPGRQEAPSPAREQTRQWQRALDLGGPGRSLRCETASSLVGDAECNGHDEDSLRLDAVEGTAGKPGKEYPPESGTKGATAVRVLENPLIRPLDRGDEIEAEVLCLVLVVSSRRNEFSFGLGMELDASHRSVERASRRLDPREPRIRFRIRVRRAYAPLPPTKVSLHRRRLLDRGWR